MIIDAHLHHYEQGFYSPRWLDYVAYRWGMRGLPQRDPMLIRDKIESGMADPNGDRMVEHLNAAGIDMGVLHPLDWELGFRDTAPVPIRRMHEIVAAVAQRHSNRLIAFAGIDPRRPDAAELFDWALQHLGMRGLKLYPSAGFYPYDKIVYPLYERCEALGLPVLCHTGGPSIALLPARFSNPIFLQDVQADFPRLKLWVAHAGHKIYREEAAAIAAVGVNTYLELSGWQAVAKGEEEFFVRWLARLRDRVGAHRLIWGSDHIAGKRVRGVQTLVDWINWFRELPSLSRKYGIVFTQEELDLILWRNAAECLGLSKNARIPESATSPA